MCSSDLADAATAAAMWAVLHRLAGDATGGGLGGDPAQPMVGTYAEFGQATGHTDLAQRAGALEHEGRQFAGEFTISARYEPGSLLVSVRAGAVPVPRTRVTVLVSGSDSSLAALTGADGVAQVPIESSSARTAAVATAVSGADGTFTFGSLTPGTYFVVEPAVTGHTSSGRSAGSVGDSLGSTSAVSVDEIKVVLRSASASGLAFLDAPANGSIAGTVHEDNDADGAPDSPDVVLASATVYLDSDNDGTFDVGEPSTTSDALGAYSFTGLYAGTYRVRSVALDSYVLSGTQPVTVTLAWTSGGESWQVTGKDLYQQGATLTVAGSVIDDVDADGTADIGEAGIAGVTVTLYRDKNGNGTYDAVTDTSVRVATTSPAAETLGQFSMTMQIGRAHV